MATSWRGGVLCTYGLVIEVAVSAVGVSLVDRAWGPVAATKKLMLLTMPTSRRLFTRCIKLCRGMCLPPPVWIEAALLADAHMSHSSFLTLASTSASTRVVPQHDLGYRNSKSRSAETTTKNSSSRTIALKFYHMRLLHSMLTSTHLATSSCSTHRHRQTAPKRSLQDDRQSVHSLRRPVKTGESHGAIIEGSRCCIGKKVWCHLDPSPR